MFPIISATSLFVPGDMARNHNLPGSPAAEPDPTPESPVEPVTPPNPELPPNQEPPEIDDPPPDVVPEPIHEPPGMPPPVFAQQFSRASCCCA